VKPFRDSGTILTLSSPRRRTSAASEDRRLSEFPGSTYWVRARMYAFPEVSFGFSFAYVGCSYEDCRGKRSDMCHTLVLIAERIVRARMKLYTLPSNT
jgi:hypothetical protein